ERQHAREANRNVADGDDGMKGHFQPNFLPRIWLTATARITTTPTMIPSYRVDSILMMLGMPLTTSVRNSAPRIVPLIVPTPPRRLAPPTTAAAMALSS